MYIYNKSNINTLRTPFFLISNKVSELQTSHCTCQPTKPEVNIRNGAKVTCLSG